MRALLVEDEALVALVAEDAMTALGFDVRVAYSAEAALEALVDAPADLAVIDIGLPDMRGDELARKIQQQVPDIAIVIASGYDLDQISADLTTHPRVTVVAKPYTDADLATALSGLGLL